MTGRPDPREDPAVMRALCAVVMERAAAAREDIGAFCDFVMRDLRYNKPIRLTPHQRVGLEFMLDHDVSVNIWPIDHAKTFVTVALTLFLLGRDPTLRGGIVSATRDQAAKLLAIVRAYIETSPELRLVFPDLRRSSRQLDPWTQYAITVDRPPGIKDPSLSAYGMDSETIIGSRLNWIVIDDLLNLQNTNTKQAREKTSEFIDISVRSRIDPDGDIHKIVLTNTAFHPDDAAHRLAAPQPIGAGWPMMRMDIYGDIFIKDGDEQVARGAFWDSPLLRPATNDPRDPACRLVAHDPDPNNEIPLWPERYTLDKIEEIRRGETPVTFNRIRRGITRDDATSFFQQDGFDACMALARAEGIYSFVSRYDGPNLTFTGLDLAISLGEENDDCAFFTFEQRPDGTRVILDIDVGKWPGEMVIRKLFDKVDRYHSVVRVENNGGQDFLRQWALKENRSLPIKAHTTGRQKAHPEHGVLGLSVEIANHAWRIPNSTRGELHPAARRFVDACLYYTPQRHTDDTLMACYFAREQAHKWLGSGGKKREGGGAGSVLMR